MTAEATNRRPAQDTDESAIDYLRRMISWINYEQETVLLTLPSVEAVLDYFDLWQTYDTEFLTGIYEAVAAGQSPEPYNAFVRKHALSWEEMRFVRAGEEE